MWLGCGEQRDGTFDAVTDLPPGGLDTGANVQLRPVVLSSTPSDCANTGDGLHIMHNNNLGRKTVCSPLACAAHPPLNLTFTTCL